jgi:acyl carrier protein
MEPAIETRLRDIIVSQLDVQANQITAEARFIDDLGADSLDIMEMIMSIEESFGVDIPDEDADSIRTFGQAVQYIQKHAGHA